MPHKRTYRSYLSILCVLTSVSYASTRSTWEAVQHDITNLLNTSDIKTTIKTYLALTNSLMGTDFTSHHQILINLLTAPLQYTSFERALMYSKPLSRAKKQYAHELLKHIPSLALCPSEALLFNANKAMIDGLKKLKRKNHHYFVESFDQMIQHEKEIYKKGNIALYHGTPRRNWALAYLHTKLHEIFNGPTPGYLQLRQPLKGVEQPITDEETRKKYLKQGGVWLKFNNAQHLLFCNCALTANLNQRTLFKEDSLTFFTAEKTLFSGWKSFLNFVKKILFGHKPKFSVRTLFDHYQISDMYHTYRHRLKKLMNFKARGNVMLQIELSPRLAQQVLFPAAPIGKKRPLIVNTQKTSDPLKIFKSLCANPSAVIGAEKTIWCLILTHDLLLNPYHPDVFGNMHVHAYSMDQRKLDKVKDRIDKIVEEIKIQREGFLQEPSL